MTATATITKASDLKDALSDAIAALTQFDSEKLEAIEGKVSALLADGDLGKVFPADDSGRQASLDQIVANHCLLGALLASTNLNLSVLQRLHNRNAMGEVSWVR